MAFHRLSVPSYYGGLPGGYDYINNALAGTPAAAGGQKSGGPNSGTYFVAFGEDATSSNANRPALAFAQNCDALDDMLRRDLAIPTRTGDVLAGAPVSSIVITGPNVFLGAAGTPNTTAGINTFLQLTDDVDNEIVDATGNTECKITAISGGTPGAGFTAGNLTLTIAPAIPAGKTYRVYYATRGNLATLPVEALSIIKIRGAEEVPAELLTTGGASLVGYAGSGNWADATTNPQGTVESQLDKIVTDLATGDGASKIHYNGSPTWADASAVVAGPLGDALDTVISTLALTTGTGGTARVGSAAQPVSFSGAPYSLSAGTSAAASAALLAALNNDYRIRTFQNGGTTAVDQGGIRDKWVLLDRTIGTLSVQLPNPTLHAGRAIMFLDKNGGINTTTFVTLLRFAAESIQGLASNYVLQAPWGRWFLVSDAVNWHVVSI